VQDRKVGVEEQPDSLSDGREDFAGGRLLLPSNEEEAAFVAERVRELRRRVPLREIAVLYRANFRSSLYEEALIEADIPFQVREGAFLDRRAARTLLPRLRRRSAETEIALAVEQEARGAGYLDDPSPDLGPAELTRQKDMARLIALAEKFAGRERRVSDFLTDLFERFESESDRDAVQLMTYHSAKGLEFEVVFLPQVEEREIPYWRAIENGGVPEERRLFYVGLTRARRELYITWSRKRARSSFLDELLPAPPKPTRYPPEGRRPPGPKLPRRKRPWRTPTDSSSASGGPQLSPNSWLPEWMRDKRSR
jgi:DNA helicase-2/ATP-dependent DNA helicase PcrA